MLHSELMKLAQQTFEMLRVNYIIPAIIIITQKINELSPSLFFYLLKTVFSIYFSFKMLGDADKISSIGRI